MGLPLSPDANGARHALPPVVVITGLMAAGKSTIAQALAERLPRSVHVRGDLYRKMIINGRAEMKLDWEPQAVAQLETRYELACEASLAYARLGFTVIYQDVILGGHLKRVLNRLRGASPGLIVLNPSLETVAQRELNRAKKAYGDNLTPDSLAEGLEALPRVGLWLDTTTLSVEETVDLILSRQGEIRVSFNGNGAGNGNGYVNAFAGK